MGIFYLWLLNAELKNPSGNTHTIVLSAHNCRGLDPVKIHFLHRDELGIGENDCICKDAIFLFVFLPVLFAIVAFSKLK